MVWPIMTAGISGLWPLKDEKADLLRRLVDGLDRDVLLWLSGYLGGVASRFPEYPATEPQIEVPAAVTAGVGVTVIYGSQTGHARGVATNLANRLGAASVPARVFAADAYPNREIKDEQVLLVAISTYGDGDPPDSARAWLDFLNGRRMPRLESLRYAVLALGDSSYPRFCHVGREVDARLAALGAQRLLPIAEADVDFEAVSDPWTCNILQEIEKVRRIAFAAMPPLPAATQAKEAASWTRSHPFAAELFVNQRITGRASDRDIRHVELLIDGSELHYQPGDSLGVWPEQDDVLVDEILTRLRLDGTEELTVGAETLPLYRWLKHRRELTLLTRPFLQAYAEHADAAQFRTLMKSTDDAHVTRMLSRWQLADLLAHCPAQWRASEFVAALRPLAPRLYSIASSPLICDEEEVHLCVGIVDYLFEDRQRWGVASHHIAGLAEGAHLPVFLEVNDRFRLPKDGDRDIIMIGPGTGVAPFRAFVQHRAAMGARGRNWLFFGNRHFRSEFLYQIEWQEALAKRQLHKLDLAFSRDGPQRVYVQQRMQEQAAELHRWIEGGAYVYVCGDAKSMARDVDATLTAIGQSRGGLSEDAARDWMRKLAGEGRYLRDVY